MATKAAIVIQRHYAVERITGALNRLLDGYGVDPVALPRLGRYPELLHNQQLEVIATALEVLSPAPEVEPEAMTLPAEDMPPLDDDDPETVTDFDISPDGVIVAETDDGEDIVSDGQEEPEPEETEDDPEPRKGKGKR